MEMASISRSRRARSPEGSRESSSREALERSDSCSPLVVDIT